jgi:hypothetical protein
VGAIGWTQNEYLCAALLLVPTYIIGSSFILADWLDFSFAGLLEICLVKFALGHSNLSFKAYLSVLAVMAYLFLCNEKVCKEAWVISNTNAKTKKILMGLLNQQPSPICIVTGQKSATTSVQPKGSQNLAPGQILYCNVMFEKMLSERLGMISGIMPQNIFRLTRDDEDSTQKLKQALTSASKPTKPGQTYNNLKVS